MNSLHWIIRIACFALLGFLFAWIANQNIPFGGYKHVTYVFGDPGPIVSELQPVSRVGGKEIAPDGVSFQKMFEDPVYFDLITPVVYRRARVALIYNNHTPIPFRIGVRGDSANQYALYDITRTIDNGRWTTGYVDIDLAQAGWLSGKYRFVISAPGLVKGDANEYIALSSVDVQLYKDPITFASIQGVLNRVMHGVFK